MKGQEAVHDYRPGVELKINHMRFSIMCAVDIYIGYRNRHQLGVESLRIRSRLICGESQVEVD